MPVSSISIAMATYNGAKYILPQLESFSRQTRLPAELIVTDDGSTDDTLDRIAKFAETSAFPIRIFRNETRLGYSENFLRAASLCGSELIAFSDQDDVWRSDKLETCGKLLDDDAAVLLVHHNARVTSSDLVPFGRLVRDNTILVDESFPWSFSQGFTQVFRKGMVDLVKDFRAQDDAKTFVHDTIFFFIANCCGGVRYLDEDLADYRQHSSNVFGWPKKVGLKRKLRRLGERRGELYRTCREQAELRWRLATLLSGSGLKQLLRPGIVTNWLILGSYYETRRRIYVDLHARSRLRQLFVLVKADGYSLRGGFRFRRSAFWLDLLTGVLLGRLLSRLGLSNSLPDIDCYWLNR